MTMDIRPDSVDFLLLLVRPIPRFHFPEFSPPGLDLTTLGYPAFFDPLLHLRAFLFDLIAIKRHITICNDITIVLNLYYRPFPCLIQSPPPRAILSLRAYPEMTARNENLATLRKNRSSIFFLSCRLQSFPSYSYLRTPVFVLPREKSTLYLVCFVGIASFQLINALTKSLLK